MPLRAANPEVSYRAVRLASAAVAVAASLGVAGCTQLRNEAPVTAADAVPPIAPAPSQLSPAFDAAAAKPLAACRGSSGFGDSPLHARTFLWRPEGLLVIKAGRDTPQFKATLQALTAEANEALRQGPFSVVDKTHVPPSGDKHDYYSVAPYSWPNPNTRDGLPYIDRDGEVTPERYSRAFDTGALERMSRAVATLALAYYLTDDPRYAEHAGELLRVWFVRGETKMNPNLRFAQAVPGRVEGRAAGLIDSYRLVRVVEAIGLLGSSGAISPTEQSSLEAWFSAYADWLQTDPIGVAERAAANNHGIYYDAQLMSFALFARRDDVARDVAQAFINNRIATQVESDGSLPRELRRTRSFHYTNYALAGAFDVATFAECFGIDLWNAQAQNGRTLRSALDFVARYAGRESEWPYQELHLQTEPFHDLLVRASWAYHSSDYAAAAARYAGQQDEPLSAYLRVAPINSNAQ